MTRETKRHHYLVAYDIADDGRRAKVFGTCKDFGNRVQYSVFLCELDPRELILMREELRGHIHAREDQVMMVELGPATHDVLSNMLVLGQPYSPPGRTFII